MVCNIVIVSTIASGCFLGSTGTSRIVRKETPALTNGKTGNFPPVGSAPLVPTVYESGEVFIPKMVAELEWAQV